MKSSVAHLKQLVQRTFNKFGWKFVRHNSATDYELKRQKFIGDYQIDLVIDVGANTGQYAQSLRMHGYHGKIHSFEPFSDAFVAMERAAGSDLLWDVHNFALGETSHTATLYLAKLSATNSLHQPSKLLQNILPDASPLGQQTVQVKSLDSIQGEFEYHASRLLLKIDTQGTELEILKGSVDLLKKVILLELELSFVPIYEHQPVFEDIMNYLHERGFRIIGLTPGYSNPNNHHVLQVDVIFLNTTLNWVSA